MKCAWYSAIESQSLPNNNSISKYEWMTHFCDCAESINGPSRHHHTHAIQLKII